MRTSRAFLPWAALVVVYVAWGATYPAIRVLVQHISPLLGAGLRFLAAGVLLLILGRFVDGSRTRRDDPLTARRWLSAALVGVLLLAIANGSVSVAEHTIPAGTAAVIVSTIPLWMAVFERVLFGVRVTRLGAAGLLLGAVGVVVILKPGGGGPTGALLLAVLAAATWGFGSVLARHLPLPKRPLLTSGIENVAAGSAAVAVTPFLGQTHVHHWGASATTAMLFLVFGGSMLGFTCFAFALARLPASTVSTYAYVNPVIAVIIGAVFLHERLTPRFALGAALVVASVALMVTANSRRHAKTVAAAGAEPA